ncbi:MAG: LamG-like jellyroll fold domain-containing protein [Bacteroidales bacterium]
MKKNYLFLFALLISCIQYSCDKQSGEESRKTSYLDYDKFITNGLIAYYPFNGNTVDESGSGLDGAGHAISFCVDRYGNEIGGCKFNGTDSYIEIENSQLLNGNGYTICFWYCADLSDTLKQVLISKTDSVGFGYALEIKCDDHMAHLEFITQDTTIMHSSDPPCFAQAGYSIDPAIQYWSREWEDKYRFVAFAFTDTSFIDYLSGFEFTNSIPSIYNSNSFNLFIGAMVNKRYKNFTGNLDDLLIYNRVLSYEEIDVLMNWQYEPIPLPDLK